MKTFFFTLFLFRRNLPYTDVFVAWLTVVLKTTGFDIATGLKIVCLGTTLGNVLPREGGISHADTREQRMEPTVLREALRSLMPFDLLYLFV